MISVLFVLPRPLRRLVIRMLPTRIFLALLREQRKREALAIARLTAALEEINEALAEYVRLANEALPSDDGTAHRRDPSA